MSETPRVLAVDLDGTLLRSDMLYETFWSAMGRNWTTLPRALLALQGGKAGLKTRLNALADVDCTTLPWNEDVLAYIRQWRADGGKTALVTASNAALAQRVADHLGLFDEVHGSDETTNLKGRNKARFLTERYGKGGFAYAGDHPADLAVWAEAHRVVTVSPSRGLRGKAEALGIETHHIEAAGPAFRAYAKAARPHQWLKNFLIFVPLVAAHRFDPSAILDAVIAFFAFSLIASSVYVVNDLLDLAADRAHPRKRKRPFASGAIPIAHGTWMALLLWLAGTGLAVLLGPKFLGVMLAYYLATTAYSFYLKRKLIVDICVLAGLYTIRILAGGVATAIPVSMWLLAFSIFFFLSLAAVKRQAELVGGIASGSVKIAGRGYIKDDLPLVQQMAISAGYVSVLVLALYLNSTTVTALYGEPAGLWGACLILLYWISRMVMVASRGDMHDDPVVYAVTDRKSLVCGVLVLACFVASAVL